MSKKFKQFSILFFILVFPSLLYVFLSKGVHKYKPLPYYGEYEIEGKDTLYHTINDFAFVNQYGDTITQDTFKNDIIVVDFFFTTCGSICPKMSNQMMVVQERFRNDNDVKILSHTVNPENDSVEVLKAYAEQYGAIKGKWHLVTGNKQKIYEMGVKSYLIPTQEDPLAEGGFLHSEQFVLIDRNKHIRGFFDGTNSNEVNDLVNAIRYLKVKK